MNDLVNESRNAVAADPAVQALTAKHRDADAKLQAIRGQVAAKRATIEAVRTERRPATQGAIDRAAERLLSGGELPDHSVANDGEVKRLLDERAILRRAEQLQSVAVRDMERELIALKAKAIAPHYRQAVQRLAAALCEVVRANAAAYMVRDEVTSAVSSVIHPSEVFYPNGWFDGREQTAGVCAWIREQIAQGRLTGREEFLQGDDLNWDVTKVLPASGVVGAVKGAGRAIAKTASRVIGGAA